MVKFSKIYGREKYLEKFKLFFKIERQKDIVINS